MTAEETVDYKAKNNYVESKTKDTVSNDERENSRKTAVPDTQTNHELYVESVANCNCNYSSRDF